MNENSNAPETMPVATPTFTPVPETVSEKPSNPESLTSEQKRDLRSPEAALARFEAAKKARLEKLHAGRPKFTKEQVRAQRKESALRMVAVKMERIKKREEIKEKVRLGMAITDEEARWLNYRSNVQNASLKAQEDAALASVSKLIIDRSDVKTLRAMVDRVAQKHGYNPLEELIKLTLPDAEGKYLLNADDRVAIHKSLLPYLTPQLKLAPMKEEEPEAQGTKVTIKQFVFPESAPTNQKIYEQPQIRVSTSDAKPAQ